MRCDSRSRSGTCTSGSNSSSDSSSTYNHSALGGVVQTIPLVVSKMRSYDILRDEHIAKGEYVEV